MGYVFIPLFNFYWIFQVIWGLAKDFNQVVRRRNLSISPAPEGVALAHCILVPISAVVSWLPFFNPVVPLAALVLFLIFVWKVGDRLNALASGGAHAS